MPDDWRLAVDRFFAELKETTSAFFGADFAISNVTLTEPNGSPAKLLRCWTNQPNRNLPFVLAQRHSVHFRASDFAFRLPHRGQLFISLLVGGAEPVKHNQAHQRTGECQSQTQHNPVSSTTRRHNRRN